MPPLSRQSHTSLVVAAALAICLAPASIFAQGSFVPGGYTPPNTIQLKPSARSSMGSDLAQPPLPLGVLPPKTSSRNVAPANVDYEIIGDKSNAPKIVDDSAFASNRSSSNPPSTNHMKADEDFTSSRQANNISQNRTASTPIVTVEIGSPSEVNLDQETDVKFRLRNAGSKSVQEVAFAIELPSHADHNKSTLAARPRIP